MLKRPSNTGITCQGRAASPSRTSSGASACSTRRSSCDGTTRREDPPEPSSDVAYTECQGYRTGGYPRYRGKPARELSGPHNSQKEKGPNSHSDVNEPTCAGR